MPNQETQVPLNDKGKDALKHLWKMVGVNLTPPPQRVVVNIQSTVHQSADSQKSTLPSQKMEVNQSQPKEKFMLNKPTKGVLLFVGLMAVGVIVSFSKNQLDNWNSLDNNQRVVSEAEAEYKVAQINAKIKALKSEEKVTPNPVAPTVLGSTYDCQSGQSVQAGFRKGTIHKLGGVGEITITGCSWYVADQEVLDISGEGFLLEFPSEPGSTSTYKSPSAENPDPTVFWNKINNSHQGQALRVLTVRGGYVKITVKNLKGN